MGRLRLNTDQNLNQSGFSGYGALLTVSRKEADIFPGSIMGALMGVTGPNVRTNVIPSYHMRSQDRFQSFSPGLRDGGEIAAAVNWLPGANDTQGRYASDWSLLRQAYLNSNELTKIRVFAPDPDMHLWSFDGFLTQLGPMSYQPEAIMSGQVGWKIVGAPQLVTPIVYELSAADPTTATTATAHSVSLGEASESGSGPATIRFNSANVTATGTSALVATVTYVDTASSENWSVSLTPAAAAPAENIVGDSYVRLYIPGEHEIWLPHGTQYDDAFTVTDAADAAAFYTAYQANGNRCFVAVYGADDVL